MVILSILSPRQIEVLKGVMRGLSNLDIANALEISEGNVKWHMTNILKHYGATTRAQLILKVAEIDPKAWE